MNTTQNTIVNSYALLDKTNPEYSQIKILQTSSNPVLEGKSAPGKLYHSLTGKIYDTLDVVLMAVRLEFRVWSGDSIDQYPLFLSDDMKTLVQLDPKTGEKVGQEPLEQSEYWINRKQQKNAKTQYFFLGILPKEKQLVFLRIGGMGFKRAKTFLNQARASGKQLYQFVTRIGVGQENSAFGPKFVPEFTMTEIPVPGEFLEKIIPVCQNFLAQGNRAVPALTTQ